MKPIIAVSMGDYNGIGPEVAIKTFSKIDLDQSIPVWIGSAAIFDYYLASVGLDLPYQIIDDETEFKPGIVHLLDPFPNEKIEAAPGKLTAEAGRASMLCIETGAKLCSAGYSHALVTSPISKEAIHKAGFGFPGHTEYLAHLTNSDQVMMMLVNGTLRVALSTIHIPVKDVAKRITFDTLTVQIQTLQSSLIRDFGIPNPKIAVLGLNPHAGDGGVIGSEESEIIAPAIETARKNGITADGPFAADGFFGSRLYQNYDAVLAMYHDQGLIPFKTLSFGKGVNFTANLSIIRTSPDHGTAYAIAGKNMADESSFLEAYNLAVSLAKNRSEEEE
ncbi:MAG: 4-hydroxythreonine-4-phosphate dehydrogenase PdxA [Balneolaceae bacterium]|nr:4-hydroxythreonine-4-phosphate dehydrogenase PdxA [Balneolaceae bacterium]